MQDLAHAMKAKDYATIERFYSPQFSGSPLGLNTGPGGITAADYDNDGFYDLFIPDGVESKLFHNNGAGTFSDVTAEAGLSGLDGVNVALFADYDNDVQTFHNVASNRIVPITEGCNDVWQKNYSRMAKK
jgi:hypothetical protein